MNHAQTELSLDAMAPAREFNPTRSSRYVRLILFASVCIILALAAACQATDYAPAISADSLCGFGHASDLALGVTDQGGVEQWAQKNVLSVRRFSDVVDGIAVECYSGHDDLGLISACLRDGRLSQVRRDEIVQGPSLGQVVKSLGAPDFVYPLVYRCERDCWYLAQLEYPKLGITIEAWNGGQLRSIGEERVFTLRADMKMTAVDCYSAGSMEDVLRVAFRTSADRIAFEMQKRMPWPGFGTQFRQKPFYW